MAKKETNKKPSLDIKDEMYWADRKKFSWLEEQSEDLIKTFSPLVAMKWLSVTNHLPDYHILMTNAILNVGFWDLSKHPELQWKLMCAVGSGQVQKHGWIPFAKSRRKPTGKLNALLLERNPQINDEELSLLRSKFTLETLAEFLRDLAMTDKEIKEILDEFKKTNG